MGEKNHILCFVMTRENKMSWLLHCHLKTEEKLS